MSELRDSCLSETLVFDSKELTNGDRLSSRTGFLASEAPGQAATRRRRQRRGGQRHQDKPEAGSGMHLAETSQRRGMRHKSK